MYLSQTQYNKVKVRIYMDILYRCKPKCFITLALAQWIKHMFSTPKTPSSCSEWFNSTPQFFMHAGVPPEHVALHSLKQLQSNSVMCTPAVVLDRKNTPVYKITTYWWKWILVKNYWIFSACLPACLFLLQHQLYKFLGGWSSSITQRLWQLWHKTAAMYNILQ